jgi:hypothetical protein
MAEGKDLEKESRYRSSSAEILIFSDYINNIKHC